MTKQETKAIIKQLEKNQGEKSKLNQELELKIREIVCQSCDNISTDLMNKKTRFENVVMARNLFMWYYYTIVKVSKSEAGRMVHKDHATALRGIAIIQSCFDGGLKYMKPYQREWFKNFKKLIQM